MCERHSWKPIEGWFGRYRCRACGAVGYRGTVTAEHHEGSDSNRIFPYICQKSGCTAFAIQKRKTDPATGRRKNTQRCLEHKVVA